MSGESVIKVSRKRGEIYFGVDQPTSVGSFRSIYLSNYRPTIS